MGYCPYLPAFGKLCVVTYVDEMRAKFGRMVLCHMVSDTEEELHAMAARIGMKQEWHQKAGTYKSHYDISLSKRKLAVYFGAVEINRAQLGEILKRKREAIIKEKQDAKRVGEDSVVRELHETE
jgi:hypothetical protein